MDHSDIVRQQRELNPPDTSSPNGILQFVLRVLAALPPDEQAGLLRKDAGENITWYGPTNCNVSVSRVCYPDGQLYKILTDAGVGGANGPAWNDDGTVGPSRYLAFAPPPAPAPQPLPQPSAPTPAPTPAPTAPPVDLSPLLVKLDELKDLITHLDDKIYLLDKDIQDLRVKPAPAYAGKTPFGTIVLKPQP